MKKNLGFFSVKIRDLYFFLFMIVTITGGIIILLASCGTRENIHISDPPSNRLVGYILGKEKLAVEPADATLLTHINYAFANVTAEGTVVLEQEFDSTHLARLTALRDYNPDLKILLSIGGWTWSDYFSDAALTEASRARFARSAVELMLKHQLDGLDIDWEYPGQPGEDNVYRPGDKENFTLLLKTVREYLNRQGDRYLLTIAAGANDRYLDHTNMKSVHRYLDFVNLMTYDFHGSWTNHTGHHSNLYLTPADSGDESSADAGVIRFIRAGVPAQKIVLGVPFYGRGWSGVDDKNNGLFQAYYEPLGGLSYDSLANHHVDRNGFTRYWDEAAQAPYLWHPDSTIFITYEDEHSLRNKADYVREQGLGGMMYWEHSHDAGRKLLNALNSYLQY